MKNRIIILVVGLSLVVACLLAVVALGRRTSNEVTLTYVGRSEVDGWRLAHFELKIPHNRQVLWVPRSVDGITLWVTNRPVGVNDKVAERIRNLQIVGGRQTFTNRPLKYPADPSLHGWLGWTTNDFSKPPGYRSLSTMKLGSDTNRVITVAEPRLPHWRLELDTLKWHVGSSAWPWKAKLLWRTKRLSALKAPVGFDLHLQSEWITTSHSGEEAAPVPPLGAAVQGTPESIVAEAVNRIRASSATRTTIEMPSLGAGGGPVYANYSQATGRWIGSTPAHFPEATNSNPDSTSGSALPPDSP